MYKHSNSNKNRAADKKKQTNGIDRGEEVMSHEWKKM